MTNFFPNLSVPFSIFGKKVFKNKTPTHYEDEDDEVLELEKNKKKKLSRPFSIATWILFFITLGVLGILGYIVFQAWQPQDLKDLKGFNDPKNASNVLERMETNVSSGTELQLSQEELNRYVASKIRGTQEGKLEILTKYNGLGIRLHDGFIEIIIDRIIGGKYHHTISLFLTITRNVDSNGNTIVSFDLKGDKFYNFLNKGGTIGLLDLPQGHLPIMLDAYSHLADLFEDERELLLKMRNIEIKPSGITLTPQQH